MNRPIIHVDRPSSNQHFLTIIIGSIAGIIILAFFFAALIKAWSSMNMIGAIFLWVVLGLLTLMGILVAVQFAVSIKGKADQKKILVATPERLVYLDGYNIHIHESTSNLLPPPPNTTTPQQIIDDDDTSSP